MEEVVELVEVESPTGHRMWMWRSLVAVVSMDSASASGFVDSALCDLLGS